MRAVFQNNLNTAPFGGGEFALNDVAPEEQAEMVRMAKEGFPPGRCGAGDVHERQSFERHPGRRRAVVQASS